MELNYRPGFLLSADGEDITQRINACLLELTLTDHSGSKADELTLKLDGSKIGKLPGKNAWLRVSLGFNGEYVSQGAFVVSVIEVKGWPETVTIKAHSTPLSGQGQGTSLQSQRTQSWDDVTLEDVLKTVSARNNLTPIIANELAQIRLEHIDQTGESDMAMLTRLSRQFSAVSKVANGHWTLIKEGEGKNASGSKKLPVREVMASSCSGYTYRSNSRTKISSAVAKWHNADTGKMGTERYGSGEPVFEIVYTYPNQEEAAAAVRSRGKEITSGSDTFTCTTEATPSLLKAFAEGHLKPVGFRPEISDKTWRIKTVVKNLRKKGGITVTFDCDDGAKK
ncbi:contractile injection system protein, VgrG/Pvc8 family [Vibrio sp. V39_P1S14PM300]|uniref:contractile injection system protein, VgrG/Pvc8 family n=1 Tax=Vibrio sp. V39_P1S14PM300 TaxID=1938690 RepID=UPI0013726EBA|nr:contractile injection system protein, VgrG/Pvc8 family [Vibrio sp. V39_P1S14PM300]NAX21017.1 late control protein D [Vibrio sp. V39_P1S14PM300]